MRVEKLPDGHGTQSVPSMRLVIIAVMMEFPKILYDTGTIVKGVRTFDGVPWLPDWELC